MITSSISQCASWSLSRLNISSLFLTKIDLSHVDGWRQKHSSWLVVLWSALTRLLPRRPRQLAPHRFAYVWSAFKLIAKFMNALNNNWRCKLINVSTDGKSRMTGRHVGVVIHLLDCADNNVLQIWWTSHQIDNVVKTVAEAIDNGVWVK